MCQKGTEHLLDWHGTVLSIRHPSAVCSRSLSLKLRSLLPELNCAERTESDDNERPPNLTDKCFHGVLATTDDACADACILRPRQRRQMPRMQNDCRRPDVLALKRESRILRQWPNPRALYLTQGRAKPVIHGPNSTESNLFPHKGRP